MSLPDVVDLIVADFATESVLCPVLYGPDHIHEHAEALRIVIVPTSDTYAPPQYVQQNAWPSGDMADGQNPRTILTRTEGARATIWARGTLVSKDFTADNVTDTFTATLHGLALNRPVQVSTTSALPAGLDILTTYYVIAPTANTFQLAATPSGSALPITTNGTGVQTVTEDPSLQQRADYNQLHALINQFILSLHRVNPGNYRVHDGVTTETTRVDRFGYVYTLNFTVEVPIIDIAWPTETGVSQNSTVQLIRGDGSVIESVTIT